MEDSSKCKKERLLIGEVLKEMPFTSTHLKIFLVMFFVFLTNIWEWIILVFVSPLIQADFSIDTIQLSWLVSSMYLGMFIGFFAFSKMCDLYGRKVTMLCGLLLCGLLSLLSSLSPNYETLWIMRFLVGMALPGSVISVLTLIGELSPVRYRSRMIIMLTSVNSIAILCMLACIYLLHDQGWHYILAVNSLLMFISALLIAKWVPESPFWLVSQGNQTAAKKNIEYLSMGKYPRNLSDVELTIDSYEQGSYLELFKAKLLGRTVAISLVTMGIMFSIWSISFWVPIYLAKHGFSFATSTKFLVIIYSFGFFSFVFASYLTNKVGRKISLIIYCVALSVALLAFAQTDTFVPMVLTCMWVYFFILGALGIYNTWQPEIYPTEVRAVGIGFQEILGRIGNTLAPILMGIVLSFNESPMFVVMILIVFNSAMIVGALFLKETEGEILE
jgi:putative MFS transporter